MRASYATAPSPGAENEDYVACGPGWAVVLDGATRPAGVDNGCRHSLAWLVRRLCAPLSVSLTLDEERPLADLAASAIEATMDAHAATCDLANPDSPSSTLVVVRWRADSLDYLVLSDSALVLQQADGTLTVVTDDRGSRLPGPAPYQPEFLSSFRNKPGGFWLAGNNPGAAYEATVGSADLTSLRSFGVFTDGVTRLNEWFSFSWPQIFGLLHQAGPSHLIQLVRRAERAVQVRSGKQHDDATALFVRGGL